MFGRHADKMTRLCRLRHADPRFSLRLAVLAALACLPLSCYRPVVDYVFAVHGTVTDSAGRPLEGVSVTVFVGAEQTSALDPKRAA